MCVWSERQFKKKTGKKKPGVFSAFEMIYMRADSVLIHGEFQFRHRWQNNPQEQVVGGLWGLIHSCRAETAALASRIHRDISALSTRDRHLVHSGTCILHLESQFKQRNIDFSHLAARAAVFGAWCHLTIIIIMIMIKKKHHLLVSSGIAQQKRPEELWFKIVCWG